MDRVTAAAYKCNFTHDERKNRVFQQLYEKALCIDFKRAYLTRFHTTGRAVTAAEAIVMGQTEESMKRQLLGIHNNQHQPLDINALGARGTLTPPTGPSHPPPGDQRRNDYATKPPASATVVAITTRGLTDFANHVLLSTTSAKGVHAMAISIICVVEALVKHTMHQLNTQRHIGHSHITRS